MTEKKMIKMKLAPGQRKDLLAASGRPDGLYRPVNPNRQVEGSLRYRKLIAEGPVLPTEEARAQARAEARAELEEALRQLEAGDYYEAECAAWVAGRKLKEFGATTHYITPAGREAATTGFYWEAE